jgi:hypothetical protein
MAQYFNPDYPNEQREAHARREQSIDGFVGCLAAAVFALFFIVVLFFWLVQ